MEVFSKFLTKTDVEARLTIPTDALPHFEIINHENARTFEVPVADSDGKVWIFKCYTRPVDHPKPVFSTNWMPFVREKGLLERDQVTFYKAVDEAGGVRFRVEVKKRTIKLFGKLMTDESL